VSARRIVCLCGSVSFTDTWREAFLRETMSGRIVIGTPDLRPALDAITEAATPLAVAAIREHHLRLIDLSHEILVLNRGQYIGESTRDEIAYAHEHGKEIRFLEPVPLANVGAVLGVSR
jgi:hypothetical protein